MYDNLIINELKKSKKVIIHRHINPDGDCMGSAYGLYNLIKLNWPKIKVKVAADHFNDYDPSLKHIKIGQKLKPIDYKGATVVVVDTANTPRIAGTIHKGIKKLIKIDHHIERDEYGDINLVDITKPACCEVIIKLIKANDLQVNKEVALGLLTGLITDTNGFRQRQMQDETFSLAGWLIKETNFDIKSLYQKLLSKPLSHYQFIAEVYKNIEFLNNVAFVQIKAPLRTKYNISLHYAALLVDELLYLNKAKMVVFATQRDDQEYRIEFRSQIIKCNEIAEKFNGGGHADASGAKIHQEELKRLKSVLRKI